MKILISGATGFIGQSLVQESLLYGYQVVVYTRRPNEAKVLFGTSVTIIDDLETFNATDVTAIINLAGAPIADKRWTPQRKKLLVQSRVEVTEALVRWCQRNEGVDCFLSSSAIGYYGASLSDDVFTETSEALNGFSHDLCQQWESAAWTAQAYVRRVCVFRTGIVLGKGGALAKMLPAYRMCLGGPIASGQQWMSWIHVEDQVSAILFLLEKPTLEGIFNFTAPMPVRNKEFSDALSKQLGRPAVFRMPSVLPKLLLGEGEELLNLGQQVIPKNLLKQDFLFRFPTVEAAFSQVLGDE